MKTVIIFQLLSLATFIIAMLIHFSTYKFEKRNLSMCAFIILIISFIISITAMLVGMSSFTIFIWLIFIIMYVPNGNFIINRYLEL
jgi:hypothetical protein